MSRWLLQKAANRIERALNENDEARKQKQAQNQPVGYYQESPGTPYGQNYYAQSTTPAYNHGAQVHGNNSSLSSFKPMLNAIEQLLTPATSNGLVPVTSQPIYPPALPPRRSAPNSPGVDGLTPYQNSDQTIRRTAARSPAPNPPPRAVPARASVPGAAEAANIRKILVLDGGGIRGLSEIILLQEIMDRLSRERGCPEGTVIHPWEEFDMICGTSTGGLLAIMLGRLRMSLDDVEEAYKSLSERIFRPVRSKANNVGKVYDFYKANGRFSSEPLEQAVREILVSTGHKSDEIMYENDTDGKACKVFVCAMTGFSAPQCLRSYRNSKVTDRLLHKCQIWQAARATSAASTFFDPIEISGIDFVDGGLMYNNPIQQAEKESREIFGNEPRMFVSLGTGQGIPPNLTGDARNLMSSIIKILTETEERNRMFHNEHQDWVTNHKLFRFNVTHGVGEIGLEEYQRVKEIRSRTIAYLDDFDTGRNLTNCSTALRSGGQRLHIIAGAELKTFIDETTSSDIDVSWCATCSQGIKFNQDATYCPECKEMMHEQCSSWHESSHRQSFRRYCFVQWQATSNTYPAVGVCASCATPVRTRFSCRTCEWSMCINCAGDDALSKSLFEKHTTRSPSHRRYVIPTGPYIYCSPVVTGQSCPCPNIPDVLAHCDRCLYPLRLNEPLYSCKTCNDHFGSSQDICSSCMAEEDAQHISEHVFRNFKFVRDFQNDASEPHLYGWCDDCKRKLEIAQLKPHPHRNLKIIVSGLGTEALSRLATKQCPTATAIIPHSNAGRPDLIDGIKCTACQNSSYWGEVIGCCFAPKCMQVFCGSCYTGGRHKHRHGALEGLQYQKLTGAEYGSNGIFCDGCMKQFYRGAFVGMECQNCKNKHFCLDCVNKVTGGEVALPGNGKHGLCPSPGRWTFHRN